jgi:YHS domain-containing protein
MTSRRIGMIRVSLTLSVLASAILLSIPALAAPEEPSNESAATALVQVETKYVCMINDQRFSKAQIPVEVDGRTYYGCCEMCKERLRGDESSRTGTDPVSGKKVDKATAVIGAMPDGTVYYFETAENLKRFKPAATDQK